MQAIPPNPTAAPNASNAKPKRKSKGPLIAGIAGGFVVFLVLFWFVLLPRIVAAKVAAAAERRSLVITYGSPSFGFGSATLSDAKIKPKSSDRFLVDAPEVIATVSFLTPTGVRIPKAKLTADGSVSKVNAALDIVRAADKNIPDGERIPYSIESGTLSWKGIAGDDSTLKFSSLSVRQDSTGLLAKLGGGSLTAASVTLSPFTVDVKKPTKGDTTIDASLTNDDGDEALTLHAIHETGGGDTFSLKLKKLRPTDFDDSVKGLDLSKTSIDGSVKYKRDENGAVSSKGDITVAHVALPPIKVSLVSISLGTTLKVSWTGTPKKGDDGVMKIDEGRLTADVLGKERTVTFTGEMSVGEGGDGPFVGTIHWTTETFKCADFSLVGGVDGTFSASGTLELDVADLGSAHTSMKLKQNCSLGGISPGNLEDLDGLLKQVPKFP